MICGVAKVVGRQSLSRTKCSFMARMEAGHVFASDMSGHEN